MSEITREEFDLLKMKVETILRAIDQMDEGLEKMQAESCALVPLIEKLAEQSEKVSNCIELFAQSVGVDLPVRKETAH